MKGRGREEVFQLLPVVLKESGRNSHCFCTYGEPGKARSFGCCFWSLSKPQNLYGPLCHCFTNMHRDCESPRSFTTRVLRACPGVLLYSVEGSQSNGSSWSSCEKGSLLWSASQLLSPYLCPSPRKVDSRWQIKAQVSLKFRLGSGEGTGCLGSE